MSRLKSTLKWSGIGIGIIAVITLTAGAVYQAVMESRDLEAWPPPGNLHSVDGADMHIHCIGEGTPTVLLEQGLAVPSAFWSELQTELAKSTRVCRYDRVGLGYSAPLDRPISTTEITSRLHALLQAEKIEDELLMVGFSAGGVHIREYYRQHPEHVAGMVFVDSTHEQQGTRLPPWPEYPWTYRNARYLAPFGYFRLTTDSLANLSWFKGSDVLKQRISAFSNFSHVIPAELFETQAFLADVSKNAPLVQLGDLPITFISRGKPPWRPDFLPPEITLESIKKERRIWDELQAELVTLSTRSRHVIAKKSDHAIHFDEPELFLNEVRKMVDLLRAERSGPEMGENVKGQQGTPHDNPPKSP